MESTINTTSFDRIIGNHVARRAIEVAAVAGASIVICGAYGSQKSLIAEAYASLYYPSRHFIIVSVSDNPRDFRQRLAGEGPLSDIFLLLPDLAELRRDMLIYTKELLDNGILAAATLQPCPCGALDSRKRPCSCTLRSVTNYRNRVPFPVIDAFDMFVPADEPSVSEVIAAETGLNRDTETLGAILTRVATAAPAYIARNEPLPFSRDAVNLLETALKRLSLSTVAVKNIRKLSTAITFLEDPNSDHVAAHCAAEAIQYVMKTYSTF